jgi:hypothetical protein
MIDNKRKWRISLIGLLALAVLTIAFIVAMNPTSATITGDSPPATGDWVINRVTTATDEVIVVRGNITINDKLTLDRTTVYLNMSRVNQSMLNVTSNGHLVAKNSMIMSHDTDIDYGFEVRGKMDIEGSTVEGCYMGLQVLSKQRVRITGTTILNTSGYGLYLINALDTKMKDITIRNDEMTCFWTNRTWLNRDDTYYSFYFHTALVYAKGGSPIIDGIKIYLTGNITAEARYIKYDYEARTRIYWHFYFIYLEDVQDCQIYDVKVFNGTTNFIMNYYLLNNYYGGYWRQYTYFYAYVINIQNYKGAKISGIDLENTKFGTYTARKYHSGSRYYGSYTYNTPYGMKLIYARIYKTFSNPGPHYNTLVIEDTDFGTMRGTFNPLVYAELNTNYDGLTEPTFYSRVILDNISVDTGGNNLFDFRSAYRFTMPKTYYMYVRISNSTFTNLTGRVCAPYYPSGPGSSTSVRSYDLRETLLVDNCTFRWCNQKSNGLFYYQYWSQYYRNDLFDRFNIFRNNVFRDNQGRFFHMEGRYYQDRGGKERTILEGNLFLNNTESGSDYFLYNRYRETIYVYDNTFINNRYSYGMYLHCQGGDLNGKKPADFRFINNTFRQTNALRTDRGWIDGYYLSGDLEVAYNNITDIETYFIRSDEYTSYSHYAAINFHHNDVFGNNGTMVYFWRTSGAPAPTMRR